MKEEEQKPILIGTAEAAKLVGVSIKTLRNLLSATKSAPVIKLPHKLLIDRNALPEWVAKNYGTYRK